MRNFRELFDKPPINTSFHLYAAEHIYHLLPLKGFADLHVLLLPKKVLGNKNLKEKLISSLLTKENEISWTEIVNESKMTF